MSRKIASVALSLFVIVAPLAFATVWGSPVYGQILKATGQLPTFEVATIKPSDSAENIRRGIGPRGADRFIAINSSVKDLIEFAYSIKTDDQIAGLSGWMTSERFNIEATLGDAEVAVMRKVPQGMDPYRPYRFMLQSLLTDRFHLKVSYSTRELPIFKLAVAKGGSKLTPSEMDSGNPPQPVKRASLKQIGAGDATGTSVTTAMLADWLSSQGELGGGSLGDGRVVVDTTNLPGKFDWTLRWTPASIDPVWQSLPNLKQPQPDGPSLFTALQEQLGLKLAPAKAPVEVLVIDHVERPSGN